MTAAAGWQFDGTFLRGNTDFDAVNGALWTQDLSASIKIIAARHDNHDNVLGNGIEATLNLDGLNTMRANLKMGGFKITGLAEATGLTDIPTYGQTAGSMTFAADVLTLLDRNGSEIDNVSIPTGGGGTGTVSSITAGAGLDGGVITTSGTISLETLTPGQTYSGGISAIVIDDHGRVTQVTTGAFANTNLGVANIGASTLDITSSTGASATIPSADPNNAGLMSGGSYTALNDVWALSHSNETRIDALEAQGSSTMKPPIELNGVSGVTQDALMANAEWVDEAAYSNSTTDWETMVSVAGEGVIEFLSVVAQTLFSSSGVRLTIDGVEVFSNTAIWTGAEADGNGFVMIGALDALEGGALGQVKFNSSFLLEHKHNGGGTMWMRSYIKYQKWS